MTTIETDLTTRLAELHTMLQAGQFIEAMEEFLDDDVVMQEGDSTPKIGKAACLAAERELLAAVAEFKGYTIASVVLGEDLTMYEAVLEMVMKDGQEVHWEQAVVDRWRDGKIVSERFYHS